MKGRGNPIANLIVLATAFVSFGAWRGAGVGAAVPILVIGIYVSLSPRLLKDWERGVLLRLGRFKRVLGNGSDPGTEAHQLQDSVIIDDQWAAAVAVTQHAFKRQAMRRSIETIPEIPIVTASNGVVRTPHAD